MVTVSCLMVMLYIAINLYRSSLVPALVSSSSIEGPSLSILVTSLVLAKMVGEVKNAYLSRGWARDYKCVGATS
ncbi:hypothetical protein DFH27DRAFT_543848 [Peziza echinospora]|nr:hypothetical protein DFH27DRAFT_543848 [Peziza echinospora]